MEQRTIRFGIAGPGVIAHFHQQAISGARNAELTAIYGRDPAKTKAFADKYGITPYSDLATFLRDGAIDAVTVATPSGSHGDIAIPAARAGKHVLCEKPLEVTPEKAQAVIDACREAGVTLGVIFQARFDDCTLLAKQAIDQGRLGRILLAGCQMRWFREQAYYDSAGWRGTWALDGGGCLMNQGIHTIDMLVHLIGQPAEVFGYRGPLTHKRIEVEDTLGAVIKFTNGAVGTVEASTSCAPGFPRRLEISGDSGTITIEDNRIVRWQFTGQQPQDEAILAGIAGGGRSIGGAADPTAIDVSGHRLQVEDFARAILADEEPAIGGLEGKRAVDLVCAIYRSMRSGRPEQL